MRARIERRRNRKKEWIRTIFAEREEKSEFHLLVKDMQLFDSEYFFKSFRMSPGTFEALLSWVAPYIKKSSLRRKVASPAERLSVTLRYLKADFHSPISGARATFSERHFAITWCVSNYTSATPTQNEGFKIQSFAAYSECIFMGAKQTPRLLLKPK